MQFGILSTKEESGFLKRRKISAMSFGDIDVCVYRLPFCVCDIERISIKRIKRHILHGIKKLKSCGVLYILSDERLKDKFPNVLDFDGVSATDKGIPCGILSQGFKYVVKRFFGDGICDTVHICDRDLSLAADDFLKEICMFAKEICVYTDLVSKAEALSESLYEVQGVYLKVYPYGTPNISSEDILIDSKKGIVRFGRDFVLDGVEFDVDFNGIYLSREDMATLVSCSEQKFKIKNFCSGKNRLTI